MPAQIYDSSPNMLKIKRPSYRERYPWRILSPNKSFIIPFGQVKVGTVQSASYIMGKKYVKFIRQDGRMVVEDQGSLNGTYVNRTLVDGSAVLRDGDEVQIGKFRMTYHTGGTASGTSGAGRV